MPAKHTVRNFTPGSYYHVFNRGVAKQKVFLDSADKRYFLSLFDRHLNPKTKQLNKIGVPYKCMAEDVELLAYCLMNNHFHLLFYLGDRTESLSECVKSITTAYAMYFNLKYKRVGPVFQGVFRASCVSSDAYLLHISRYIHLNPRTYQTYKYSSLPAYLSHSPQPWLKPDRILDLFNNRSDYRTFVADYVDHRDMLSKIKAELANQ